MSGTVLEQLGGQASYITREDPAFLLLLTIAAHPDLTLDYSRMSTLSRVFPEAMWTTEEEIGINIRALIQLAGMIRRGDSHMVNLDRTGVGEGDSHNDRNHVPASYITAISAGRLLAFAHDQETSLPFSDDRYTDGTDNDDDDRTSVASWISGRVWIPSDPDEDDDHTDGFLTGAGDSDEEVSDSSGPEWASTDTNPGSPRGPILDMILDECPTQLSSSASLPESVQHHACSEYCIEPGERPEWAAPSGMWDSNYRGHGPELAQHHACSEYFINSGARRDWAALGILNHSGHRESNLDRFCDSASVCSIGGGVWMGD